MEITGLQGKVQQLGNYTYSSQWSWAHCGDVITVIRPVAVIDSPLGEFPAGAEWIFTQGFVCVLKP